MYFRFLLTLGIGLFGVCLVLTVLLESTFAHWDLAAEWHAFLDKVSEKRGYDYALRDEDDDAPPRLAPRIIDESRARAPAVQPALLAPIETPPPMTGMHRYWIGPSTPSA